MDFNLEENETVHVARSTIVANEIVDPDKRENRKVQFYCARNDSAGRKGLIIFLLLSSFTNLYILSYECCIEYRAERLFIKV